MYHHDESLCYSIEIQTGFVNIDFTFKNKFNFFKQLFKYCYQVS